MVVKQAIQEKRGFVRAKRMLSIEFKPAKGYGRTASRKWHLSATEDMSLGGVSFYTDQEYKVGDILQLHVVMSGVFDMYKGFGEIVRLDRKKLGVYSLVAVKFITHDTAGQTPKAARSGRKSKARKRV